MVFGKITDKLSEDKGSSIGSPGKKVSLKEEIIGGDQGTLDSICCFKAFYHLSVFAFN
jgi:hypothetical protein